MPFPSDPARSRPATDRGRRTGVSARELKLALPASIRLRADEVIE